MLKGLFKPKWQNKNPAVRLKAINSLAGNSQELISLAKEDPDQGVRYKAIQHLHHLATLTFILTKADANAQNIARQRLTELALDQTISDKALEEVYSFIEDISVHTQIASNTRKSTALRKQALKYLDNQTLFFTLAKSDPSKEIQFLAASQLTNFQQIKTLEKLTTNNKNLRKLLKERANEYEEKENQHIALNNLCNELKNLGNTGKWEKDKTRYLTIQQQWKNVPKALSRELQATYDDAVLNYEQKLALHQAENEKRQPLRNSFKAIIQSLTLLTETLTQTAEQSTQIEIDEIITAAEQSWEALETKLPSDELHEMQDIYSNTIKQLKTERIAFSTRQTIFKQFQQLQNKAEKLYNSQQIIQQKDIKGLQNAWQKLKAPIDLDTQPLNTDYKNIINRLKEKLNKQIEQSDIKLKKIQQTLDKMEAEISADQLGKAIKSYQTATTLLRQSADLPKQSVNSAKRRVAAASGIVKSAQDWRHWGTDQAREQLIEQARMLCDDTTISPIKRAEEIKSLRKKWKNLGKIDPMQHQKLWETFDATCSKAYEPCKKHFKEEANTRKNNLQQRQSICTQLQQLETDTDWKNTDWKEVNKAINTLRVKWKRIGSVDRTQWNIINEQFNTAMDALEVHLASERRINWTKRESLVKQAEALVAELASSSNNEDILPSLLEQAKTLQVQWQPTVTVKRSDEKKLWDNFRTAIDSLFNSQREKQNSARDEFKSSLQKKQKLLKEVESLTNLTGENLLSASSKIKQLKEQFDALVLTDKNRQVKELDAKFTHAENTFQKKLTQHHHNQRIEQLTLLGKKAKVCAEKEAGENPQSNWEALKPLENDNLEIQIQQRFNHDSRDKQEDNLKQLLALTLEIEILLELQTPETYQQDRMQLQVARLSEQMLSTTQDQNSNEELALQKIQNWYLIPTIAKEQRESLNLRFSHVEKWLEKQKNY